MSTCTHTNKTDLSYTVTHSVCHDCQGHNYQGRWMDKREWEADTDADQRREYEANERMRLRIQADPAIQFVIQVLSDILDGKTNLEDVSAAGAALSKALPQESSQGPVSREGGGL